MYGITRQPLPCPAGEPELASKRVMIADDSLTVRHLVEVGLLQANDAVLRCADGMEALHTLLLPGTFLPDVIPQDREMPRMNGYQFARIPPDHAHATGREVNRLKARLCHVSASLSKPFTTQQF